MAIVTAVTPVAGMPLAPVIGTEMVPPAGTGPVMLPMWVAPDRVSRTRTGCMGVKVLAGPGAWMGTARLSQTWTPATSPLRNPAGAPADRFAPTRNAPVAVGGLVS